MHSTVEDVDGEGGCGTRTYSYFAFVEKNTIPESGD